MTLKGDEIFKVAENVVWQEIDDKLIVLNLDNGFYFTLNDTAKMIWHGFIQNMHAAKILDAIVDRYQVSRIQAGKDLDGIIELCVKESLITNQEASGGSKKNEKKQKSG